MYCSICGAHVPQGRSECAVCGERVIRMPNASAAIRTRGVTAPGEEMVGLCPRCGFDGPGSGYFNRGRNIAKLVGLTVITGGLMGMGGLAYWLLRKDHRVCPACGLKWGPYGERAVALARVGSSSPVPAGARTAAMSPWLENKMRKRSVALFIFAAILMIAGVANAELPPILMSVMAAAGGYFLHRDAETKRSERREAVIAGLQPEVLRLAAQRKGRLTVTEVASSLGWALPRAEKVLNSLDDGLRVRSEVTDEGVIVYEFPEVMFNTARLTDPTSGAAMA